MNRAAARHFPDTKIGWPQGAAGRLPGARGLRGRLPHQRHHARRRARQRAAVALADRRHRPPRRLRPPLRAARPAARAGDVERHPGACDRRPLRPDPLQPGASGRSGSAPSSRRRAPGRAADRRRRLQRLGRQARRADDGLRPDPRLRAGRSVVARQHLSVAHSAVLDGPHLRRAASAASRPRCRAARPGRGCRTTCRSSRSSPSRRACQRHGRARSQRPANPRPARRCVRGTRSTC